MLNRGGRCETFGLFWNYESDPTRKLVYIDCNRLIMCLVCYY